MGMKCGIVGLPNVGKSTFFNLLSRERLAKAENFPFCTIDPNIAVVPIIDQRLDELAKKEGSAKIIYNTLQFVDIAGLVAGASKGEGLGNKFLGNIEQVDLIIHVLRCFEDDNIHHVLERVDPVTDYEIIDNELRIWDLDKIEKFKKKNKTVDPELLEIEQKISKGERVNDYGQLNLLSAKPVIILCNGENEILINKVKEKYKDIPVFSFPISLYEELQNECGENIEQLNGLIKKGFEMLDLITFFTVGPKEARAWTITKGTNAQYAAGEIHTDFIKHFIKAKVNSFEEYLQDANVRTEGKDYIVHDGDVILFMIGGSK